MLWATLDHSGEVSRCDPTRSHLWYGVRLCAHSPSAPAHSGILLITIALVPIVLLVSWVRQSVAKVTSYSGMLWGIPMLVPTNIASGRGQTPWACAFTHASGVTPHAWSPALLWEVALVAPTQNFRHPPCGPGNYLVLLMLAGAEVGADLLPTCCLHLSMVQGSEGCLGQV